jgi:hypothetical protein
MGSWNETCGVSRLPILDRDPVRCFFLVGEDTDARGAGGFCHPSYWWSPLGPPLVGIYGDYGRIEKYPPDDLNSQFLFSVLEKGVLSQDAAKRYDLSKKDLPSIQEAVERGALSLRRRGEDRQVAQMFVLESIYQTMIADKPTAWHAFGSLEEYRKSAWEFADRVVTKRPLGRAGVDFEPSSWHETDNIFLSNLFGPHGPHSGSFELRHFLIERLPLVKSREGLGFIDACAEFVMFKDSMSALRAFWSPQSGKGSQDFDSGIHVRIAQEVIRIHEKRAAELAEEEAG